MHWRAVRKVRVTETAASSRIGPRSVPATDSRKTLSPHSSWRSGAAGVARLPRVVHRRELFEIELDRLREVLGGGPVVPDASGEDLPDVPHPLRGEDRLARALEPGEGGGGENGRDALEVHGGKHLALATARLRHAAHPGMGEGAPHERHVARPRQPDVGHELPFAEEVPRVLDPLDARADAAPRLPHDSAIASPVVLVRWEYYAGRQSNARRRVRPGRGPGTGGEGREQMVTHTHDVIVTGGTLIDPAAGRSGSFDLGIRDGRVTAVETELPRESAPRWIDATGKLVVPGLIDTHAHVYEHVTGKFGLDPDHVGVRSGVTTLVDQGGPSCMTIPGFRHYVADRAESRVLCFISSYLVGGLEGHRYPELYGPDGVNVEHTARAIEENRDLVKGIKAHAEIGGASRWGVEVIKLAKDISRRTGVPVYVHLGQLWPLRDGVAIDADAYVQEAVPLLDSGDVLAHPFTRHPGGFVSGETGKVHPIIEEALARGVKVDVGHGSHFSFDMARRALDAGIRPLDPRGGHARLQRAGAGGADERRRAVRQPFLRGRAFQPHHRHERAPRPRDGARRGGRDGDREPREDAPHGGRDRDPRAGDARRT